ncbi:MAG: alpha/beta fold hydrolase [Solirubrobacteraceae bacterium]
MTATDETLAAGKGWLVARLEKGAHPLDGLDPDAARATIDSLTGLDPEPWTAAWGGLADDFAAQARAADDPAHERELWFQAYRAAFMGRYPVPNHPLKEQEYARAREFFLNATKLEDPPLEVIELPFEDSRLRFYLTRPATGEARPPVAMVWAGIDTWKEEMHVRLGALMRSRGFAVLLVDMPGVGESPVLADGDAERQWTPIFDWLADREDLDGSRCAAIGGSFGGYWAMKLAYTHRDRLACAVNWGGGVHITFTPEWQESSRNASSYLMDLMPARADLRRRDLRGLRRPLPGALPARSGTPRPAERAAAPRQRPRRRPELNRRYLPEPGPRRPQGSPGVRRRPHGRGTGGPDDRRLGDPHARWGLPALAVGELADLDWFVPHTERRREGRPLRARYPRDARGL